jgi:hypothetical protein
MVVGLLVATAAIATYVYVFLLRPPPAKVVARFTAIEGSVRVKTGDRGAWVVAKVAQELRTGDVVQTGLKAAAAITFLSGNVVRVRPDSVVLVSEGAAALADEGTAWHVQSGQVSFELKQRTEIVTPTARTRASADSTGNVNVTEEGGTGIKIFKGAAEVSTKTGQTVTVTDNQAVLVDAQGRAGPKVALPPAPTLIAPPTQAELPYLAPPQATARLTWDGVNGAATYRIAVDYNVVQADLLLSAALEESDVAGTNHDLRGLDTGKYFWRVAGVTREGLEGEFSRVSIFAVVPRAEPTPPPVAAPRLEVQAVDLESVLEVKGRTDPGAQVTVDAHAAKVLPDGRFHEHVRKIGQPFVVIRATGADGQFTEEKLTVPAR